ncbi:MAG TPA: FHA domain-containing protein [Polyangiales bacterium]|nr:FHA domain-containing protein [Polyangiales bacterium]
MTQDHNKKTLRQFQCRDYLWEIFEQMGAELECSTDYLVNEAMRQYARSRNWGAQNNAVGGAPAVIAAPPLAAVQAPARPSLPNNAPPLPPNPRIPAGMPPLASPRRPPQQSGSNAAVRPVAATVPPPLPGGGAVPVARGDMPPLSVIFNGQKVPVNKEEFVIGRGSKTADLPIKDGNISRRHAAIVLQNGAFYMKDLGSTNGVEFNGERVESRRIEEGDVYQLCDYELRFTYH